VFKQIYTKFSLGLVLLLSACGTQNLSAGMQSTALQAPGASFSIQNLNAPAHLSALQLLLDGDQPANRLSPARNDYSSAKTMVWPGEGLTSNATVCAPLVSLALKHSYASQGLSSTAFKGMTGGSSSPYPSQYYQAFQNAPVGYDSQTQTHWQFQQIFSLFSLQAGDLIAMDYMDAENGCALDKNPDQTSSSSSANGHMAVLEAISEPVAETMPGTGVASLRFDLVVLDSSSSYHGSQDTRVLYPESQAPFVADQGLGRGTMRFYADPQTGTVLGYKWSTGSSSTCLPSQRRVAFGRINSF